mgnify:CR=1 FL=1
MPSAKILGGSKKAKLDDAAFGASFNEALVHETVRAELNARRQGTHATKTRGNVRGGGAKPWRQKGTGRARAGSSRSPIWTGGGTIFGPSPRHYTFKVNRKERRAALRSALSLHADRGSIAVFDPGAFDTPSTKQAVKLLSGWDAAATSLVEGDTVEQNAESVRRLLAGEKADDDAIPVVSQVGALRRDLGNRLRLHVQAHEDRGHREELPLPAGQGQEQVVPRRGKGEQGRRTRDEG